MKKALFSLLLAGIGLCFAMSAHAATSTATMPVVMTVLSTGSIQSTTTLDYGSVTPGAATPSAQSTITVLANGGSVYYLSLDGGLNGDGVNRNMTDTVGDLMPYTLYMGSNGGTTWGNNDGYGTQYTASESSVPQAITVYGQVNGATIPDSTPAGGYHDTVTATLTY